MRVITTHPIKEVNSRAALGNELEWYSSIDGKNEVQVKHFQIYANKKGAGLKVNGRFDRKTRTAYARLGSEWERAFKAAYPNYQITSPTGKRRSGAFWDTLRNVWVAAVDSGIVDQGIQAIADSTGARPPMPAPVSTPTPDVTPEVLDETTKDTTKGSKGWLWALGIVAVSIGGYVAYKKLKK